MPDTVRDPLAGPDAMYSTKTPPPRGQWHTFAALALQLLDIPLPTSRYEATVVAVRLARASDFTSTTNPPR